MRSIASLVLLMVVPGTQLAVAEVPSKTNIPTAPDSVIFERDIHYRAGHPRWVLNVIRPKATSVRPRPGIVLVHGGGWTGGDHYRFSRMAFAFAQKGYVAVTPTYRMIRDAPFPACLYDVKNAIRWVRAHAKQYNVDPDRIGAYGNSAGGTLALTAAITAEEEDLEGDGSYQEFSSALQAVVCSGAVGNMLHATHSKRAASVYRKLAGGMDRGKAESELRAVARRASPSSYVRGGVPPIMLVHGAKDTVVFIDSTDEFYEAMKAVDADITYLRFEDAGHGVMGQKRAQTSPAMHTFFEEHLRRVGDRQ